MIFIDGLYLHEKYSSLFSGEFSRFFDLTYYFFVAGVSIALIFVVWLIVSRVRTRHKEALFQSIFERSVRDNLTGLYNRDGLADFEKGRLKAAQNNGEVITAVMIDADELKVINDTYGHDMGDEAIRAVARVILSSIRLETDFAARFGGDEFLVVFVGMDGVQVKAVAERLLTKIAEARFGDRNLSMTVSIGISSQDKTKCLSELIKQADTGLLRGKSVGRNTIIDFELSEQ